MRPVVLKVGPLVAASANAIALSQSAVAAGALTLNGATASAGVATLDNARRVAVASAGNDSGITFTITGTNWSGAPISETLTGANAGAVSSALDYLTVTRVATSGATASTVTVGTTGVAASNWFRMDDYGTSSISMQCNVTGTANGTLQYTLDDPNSITFAMQPAAKTWLPTTDSNGQGFSTSFQTSISQNQAFIRVLLNSGTGSIVTTLVQGGTPPA